ncbi:MAG: hypothetical protein JNM12_01540 [Alphaproteobacteria bacterium]|nr:hypothetical protein [Alphaproteobacteria bacterium]
MTNFPQTERAVKYAAESYSDMGGFPNGIKPILANALQTIQTLVDRPDDEKDGLMAATALLLSKDMTVYKEPPQNIESYSSQVQQILDDANASRGSSNPYAASPDLMQIGLAMALAARDTVLSMYSGLKEQIDLIAQEDPRMLKTMQREMEKVLAAQPNYDSFFTGAQPRLEGAAKEFMNETKAITDDVIAHFATYTSPAAADAKPAAKKGGKSFDL